MTTEEEILNKFFTFEKKAERKELTSEELKLIEDCFKKFDFQYKQMITQRNELNNKIEHLRDNEHFVFTCLMNLTRDERSLQRLKDNRRQSDEKLFKK